MLLTPRKSLKLLVKLSLAGVIIYFCSTLISTQHDDRHSAVSKTHDYSKLDFYQSYTNSIYIKVPEPECGNGRFLIYRCTSACQGLGNRQQGIISVFLLALLTGRTFILEMTTPCDINEFLEPNLYDWNKCKQSLTQEDIYEQKYYNTLAIGKYKLPSEWNLLDFDVLWPESVISLTLRSLIVDKIRLHRHVNKTMGWIHQLSDTDVEMSVLGVLFKPKPQLVQELTQFFHERVGNRKLVCGHLRTYESPTFKFDVHYFRKANISKILTFLKKYDNNDKYAMYIASDSVEMKAEASKIFSNFVSYNSTIIHIDREQERLDEMCSGFHSVIVEQIILSKCNVLVLSRGTLGFTAAVMRGTSNGLYIYSLKGNEVESVNDLSKARRKYKMG